jgi:hypothetical protein
VWCQVDAHAPPVVTKKAGRPKGAKSGVMPLPDAPAQELNHRSRRAPTVFSAEEHAGCFHTRGWRGTLATGSPAIKIRDMLAGGVAESSCLEHPNTGKDREVEAPRNTAAETTPQAVEHNADSRSCRKKQWDKDS